MSDTKDRYRQNQADPLVSEFFEQHREAIVIYIDPEEGSEGESNVGVFTKVRPDGKLMALLSAILKQVIRLENATDSNQISPKATAG